MSAFDNIGPVQKGTRKDIKRIKVKLTQTHTCTHSDTYCNNRLTLEAEVSTVEEVMAVEASLTVVLESCSPVGLDIMRVPCGLHKHTHTQMSVYITGKTRIVVKPLL